MHIELPIVQSQTIMTMTRTRRKQKQEFMKHARQKAEEKKADERRRYRMLAVAVAQQAAYEPALFQAAAAAAEEHDGKQSGRGHCSSGGLSPPQSRVKVPSLAHFSFFS